VSKPSKSAAASPGETENASAISVYEVDASGRLVGPTPQNPIVRSPQQWRRTLTAEQYHVAREGGTERAGSGELLHEKREGVYACVCCGLPLFRSEAKFDSGTGWPSFYEPIAETNVRHLRDASHGMVRVEVRCPRCEAHLGHVFEDGPEPTGLRYCMNSASLRFGSASDFAAAPETGSSSGSAGLSASAERGEEPGAGASLETAVLAGGCFWCTEAVYDALPGVRSVESGYAGGDASTATYESVSTGTTGHAEAVRIVYDPAQISFSELLDVFFQIAHDPTQVNRQGADVGSQYRSAVFYADDSQRREAEAMIEKLNAPGAFSAPIATTLEPLEGFYPAETYHQDFVKNHPNHPYVAYQARPKLEKLARHRGARPA